MKVRIGIGVGRETLSLESFDALGAAIVAEGFDSLWLSEVLTSAGPDPLVGLAFAAGRHPRLKVGTTMLAPGRHVLRLAKALATLDQLSVGRLLVTLVPGLTESPEREAIGVEPAGRGAVMDELLPLLRQLLSGEAVTYHGALGDYAGVILSPLPVQRPLEFWLGGMARSALVRCGRLGDGWLPSLCTPEEAAAGRRVIEQTAEEAGREIDPEHFGVSVGYAAGELDDAARAAIARRRAGRRLGAPVPVGLGELRRTIEAFLAVGFSKFVVRPLVRRRPWQEELGELAAAVGDLQS